MDRVLAINAGANFLGSRSTALSLYEAMAEILDTGPADRVVLDFTGIEGASHGFLDQLFSPLAENYDDALETRVVIRGCTSAFIEEITAVAELHALKLPSFETAAAAMAFTQEQG